MTIKVDVTRQDGSKFGSTFDTKEKAEAWVEKNHKDAEVTYEEVFSDKIRAERDRILCSTDWLFMSDVVIEKKQRMIYKNYRQYLREVPNKKTERLYSLKEWMRVNHPEEFQDGGKADKIISKFEYYF